MKKYVWLFIIFSLFVIGCGKNNTKEEKLTCTEDITTSGIPMFQTTEFNLIGERISKIDTSIIVTLPDEYKPSIDTFVKSFEESYTEKYKNDINAKVDIIKTSDSEILIKVIQDYSKLTDTEMKALGFLDSNILKLKGALEEKGYSCK